MNNTLSTVIVAIATVAVLSFLNVCKTEGFTAAGWTLTHPSEWWFPQKYNASNWLTTYYPDQLSQPTCLSYNRGNAGNLNFNSSSYRFWRF